MMSNKGRECLRLLLMLALVVLGVVNGEYLIEVGSYDSTGPAANQNAVGIHFRLRVRLFVVAESPNGARFTFANLDAGMASPLVTIKVLKRLRSRFGDLYTEENVAISGIHTHAGPGGYLQYVLYIVTSLRFVKRIVQAHNNLKPGSIFINRGDVDNAGISRSPSAYLLNPTEERARYPTNVDKQMTLLKFVDEGIRESIGAFNWFTMHGTSMSRDNRLISGDNKGAAARFFEDWYRSALGKGKSANRSTVQQASSRSSKVRINDGSLFVAAFCQSKVGDVSPNVLGAFCTDTENCAISTALRAMGTIHFVYPDEILSTKIIGDRQFKTALELFKSAKEELTGKVDYRHAHVNFTDIEVELEGNRVVKTCPAAVGAGFAAGTTDGLGQFGFLQGDTEINPFWKLVRNLLKRPSAYQEKCQKPKPVLLSTGEMFHPYTWAPAILPIQVLRLGQLIILSVPGVVQLRPSLRPLSSTDSPLAGFHYEPKEIFTVSRP
ncbi:hypothetical protein EUGRSUZ_F01725 [Eucalyptus grandis]|uniref:Uncharacterized protein n=2 Tax=Eucalyptus grandis TaxID=71139 RepID=A0ACC3KFT3_EUCGR|nr:hypothetical protein EUGRSUZ_F01725 [Eucalyptus grandis]